MKRSKVSGTRRLRRILKAMPEMAQEEVGANLRWGIAAMTEDAQTNAPKLTGNMASQITGRVAKNGLTGNFGFRTKAARRKAWYAKFVLNGTKGSPERNIPAMPANPFLFNAFERFRKELLSKVSRGRDKIITAAQNKGGPPDV